MTSDARAQAAPVPAHAACVQMKDAQARSLVLCAPDLAARHGRRFAAWVPQAVGGADVRLRGGPLWAGESDAGASRHADTRRVPLDDALPAHYASLNPRCAHCFLALIPGISSRHVYADAAGAGTAPGGGRRTQRGVKRTTRMVLVAQCSLCGALQHAPMKSAGHPNVFPTVRSRRASRGTILAGSDDLRGRRFSPTAEPRDPGAQSDHNKAELRAMLAAKKQGEKATETARPAAGGLADFLGQL
ncbi:hypothetical protein MSPP1_000845 [Malassezia sp. CBS 17886]|nr:hypothetical protein MSPP1_000845 [Malassezia sp. CBS 17886]